MLKTVLEHNSLVLMEGAIVEQLRRSDKVSLHPRLVNAPLIYDELGHSEVSRIYQSYIDVAKEHDLPFIMCTPTWRTNRERVNEENMETDINGDAVQFLQQLRKEQGAFADKILIGGMVGCRNDCYLPEEGLTVSEAEKFHAWQIAKLADAGVDFLIAETLPAVSEALGIAKAMEKTELPYVISFVINRQGNILDGSSLLEAVKLIDSSVTRPPLGYMINCAYPTFLQAESQPNELFDRLIGYLANSSSRDHCELDGAEELVAEKVSDWGNEMLKLNRQFGIKVLGGCCGTNPKHLSYLLAN